VIVSGVDVHRPCGQTRPDLEAPPVFGPSRLLDFELEMAFFVGGSNKLGHRIKMEDAENHIFGMVVMNDWSARDIQKWEYVPLGPFGGKNWATSISPWVVTMEALEPFRVQGPVQEEPEPLPYLKQVKPCAYDIGLTVEIVPEGSDTNVVCRSNFKHLYWPAVAQLVHHSVTYVGGGGGGGGCSLSLFCGEIVQCWLGGGEDVVAWRWWMVSVAGVWRW
jgi:fumarylacetoacetase